MPFTPADGVPVQMLPDGRVRLTAPLVWTGTRGDAVTMPAGTISDGATRPWFTGGLVDEWGPIARAAFVHDVLCDAANAWTRAGCPEDTRPRFLGADIDGALRAAARDLGAANGERWLYWVAVRWSALFGSKGRRHAWASTLGPVLALTVPALLVALPAVVGALVSRLLLVVCELAAWPWTRTPPTLAPRARRPLVHGLEAPRQMPEGRAQVWHAARSHGLDPRRAPVVLPGSGAAVAPVGPSTGPQAVVHARRVAARHRDEAPAPWCASYLQQCTAGCDPAVRCERQGDPADWLVASSPCPRCGSYRCGCPPLPCPPGTHSNTGSAADAEIAACPRCNPQPEERTR